MAWSITGVVFQLLAGVMLALPFIFPGKIDKIDQEWHEGRGKIWIMVIIWVFLVAGLIVLFGMADRQNHTTQQWAGISLASSMAFFVYISLTGNIFVGRINRLPKWLKKNKMATNIRYYELVKANQYTLTICGIIFIISNILLYFIIKNGHITGLWVYPTFLVLLFFGFSALTSLLALAFLFFNEIIGIMNSHLKKPLWTYVLIIFIIGCILQIVGIAKT